MSRLFTRNSRGRQPLLPGPKITRSKDQADETYQEPGTKRHRPTKSYAATVQQAKRRRVASTASDSSSANLEGEDASDEDSETEDDSEPAVIAPSRRTFVGEAGRMTPGRNFDTASLAGSVDSMFGDHDEYYDQYEDPNLSPEENLKRFETGVFANSDDDDDDDDDDAYRAVDEISDSDEDEAEIVQYEEQQLLAALTDGDVTDEEFDLNQIDGLSAYGFGDDSDSTVQFPPSSQASEDGAAAGAVAQRHVRFDMESTHTFHLQMSSSPTISRALLPSALPEHGSVFGGPASAAPELHDDSTSEDSYDSDATEDCLPEEALQSTPAAPENEDAKSLLPPSPSPSPKPAKKASQRKGPPRGVFIDEGDKASGILDSTGKIMLITHPHLLGEEFARRYGNSASNSPSLGFEELIDGSETGDTQELGGITPAGGTDIMLASLNSSAADPANSGHAIGPQEAFYPAAGFQIGDYSFDVDDFDAGFPDDVELGEDVINMEDVIKFDDDSEDSDEATSPIFMPPVRHLTDFGKMSSNEFSHLTNNNVTAFRRNAETTYATLNETPFSQLSEFSTPARSSRKRKANDSPYTSSHYNGVTPLQRMRDPYPPSTPDSAVRPKRRRLMTA